jgi:DNA-directed RNA polymerase specialized sigma24 family protein
VKSYASKYSGTSTQELSYEEIAERMGCSTGTVGTWLNRARKLLARKLEGLKGKI